VLFLVITVNGILFVMWFYGPNGHSMLGYRHFAAQEIEKWATTTPSTNTSTSVIDNGSSMDILHCSDDASVFFPTINGTLLERLPTVVFWPYKFLQCSSEQNDTWMEIYQQNKRHAESAYIHFLYQTTSKEEEKEDGKDEHPDRTPLQRDYLYIHVHKAGGTSMREAQFPRSSFPQVDILYNRFRKKNKVLFRQRSEQWVSNGNADTHQNGNVDKNSIHQTVASPALLFSFVRDPAVRFLSGVGQVLAMPTRWGRLEPCISYLKRNETDSYLKHDEDPTPLIQCLLDKMEGKRLVDTTYTTATKSIDLDNNDDNNNSSDSILAVDYLDLHLLPQAYELYDGVLEMDHVPVHLMDLAQLDKFFKVFGARPPKTHAQSRTSGTRRASSRATMQASSTAKEEKTKIETRGYQNNNNIHRRRRLVYTEQPYKLSPTQIFFGSDASLLPRVCKLYDVDVQLLRQMGQQGIRVPSLCIKV
jgi:hypothetical protein